MIGQLNVPINSLIGFMQNCQDAKISLERLARIHDKDNEVKESDNNVEALPANKDINFKNVFFRYGSQATQWVLEDLTLRILQGKVTAVVGASGSGKITMLKLLLKFNAPNMGAVQVGANSLENYNSDYWRKNVGVVMQKASFSPIPLPVISPNRIQTVLLIKNGCLPLPALPISKNLSKAFQTDIKRASAQAV